MNSNHPRQIVALLLAALALVSLAGCASMGASNTKSLLSASGFRTHEPATGKQQELYAAMSPYKVERITAKGQTFYAFKDEKNGIVYLGNESNYQRYQALAVQQRIAQMNYQAAQMEERAAMGWYGAYGPYVGGAYRHGAVPRRR